MVEEGAGWRGGCPPSRGPERLRVLCPGQPCPGDLAESPSRAPVPTQEGPTSPSCAAADPRPPPPARPLAAQAHVGVVMKKLQINQKFRAYSVPFCPSTSLSAAELTVPATRSTE